MQHNKYIMALEQTSQPGRLLYIINSTEQDYNRLLINSNVTNFLQSFSWFVFQHQSLPDSNTALPFHKHCPETVCHSSQQRGTERGASFQYSRKRNTKKIRMEVENTWTKGRGGRKGVNGQPRGPRDHNPHKLPNRRAQIINNLPRYCVHWLNCHVQFLKPFSHELQQLCRKLGRDIFQSSSFTYEKRVRHFRTIDISPELSDKGWRLGDGTIFLFPARQHPASRVHVWNRFNGKWIKGKHVETE